MAFTTIPSSIIAAGQAVIQTLLQYIKDDLDDHESRLTTLSAAVGSLPPINFDVYGAADSWAVQDGLLYWRVSSDITLTAARLLVNRAGTSGTLSVDIEYKRGGGAWTTILTGNMTAGYASGDNYLVTGTLAVSSLLAGDLLRLNIDSVQKHINGFSAYLENTVT